MGKPKDPDYWKKWRAAHPEYRERERERRRQAKRTEDRSKERQRAKAKAAKAAKEKANRREASRRWYRKNAERERVKARERMRERYEGASQQKLARSAARKAAQRAQRLHDDATRLTQRVVKPDDRTTLHDTLYEDAHAIAIERLWFLRGRPPAEREDAVVGAVAAYVKSERTSRSLIYSYDDESRLGLRATLGLG